MELSNARLASITKAFSQVDKDGDGEIGAVELRSAFESITGEAITDEVLDNIMSAVDVDGDGTITMQEFTNAMKGWWDEHDKSNRGSVGPNQLKGFLGSFKTRRPESAHFNLSAESQQMKDNIIAALNQHNSPTQKVVVYQVYINRIFAIDDVSQQLNIDMYLKLNWRSKFWIGKTDEEFQADNKQTDWWEPGVEVSNAIELEKQTADEEAFWLEIPEAGVLAYTQRYIGTVSTLMDLHTFPFDKQVMTINFESFHWKESDMKMIVPATFRHQLPPPPGKSWPSMNKEVKLHDWHIDEIEVKEEAVRYEFEDRTYSQVQVCLKVKRSFRYYFWKILTVLWLIVGLSWSVYFCDPEQLTDRLAITVTLFLAAVAFNFTIASSLPKVPYNTLLDQNLLVAYGYIATAAVESIIVYHRVRKEDSTPDDIFDAEPWFAFAFGLSYICYNLGWIAFSMRARRTAGYQVGEHPRSGVPPGNISQGSIELSERDNASLV